MAAENGIRRDGFKTCPYRRKYRPNHSTNPFGYKAEGEEYLDEGCPHVMMRKVL